MSIYMYKAKYKKVDATSLRTMLFICQRSGVLSILVYSLTEHFGHQFCPAGLGRSSVEPFMIPPYPLLLYLTPQTERRESIEYIR